MSDAPYKPTWPHQTPDGEVLRFESIEERDAYRQATEPPWLTALRRHCKAVKALKDEAERALAQPRGRADAFRKIHHRLATLDFLMGQDIRNYEKPEPIS